MSNLKGSVFTAADKSRIGTEYIKQMQAQRHRAMPLPLGNIGFNKYFADLMPGEICAVQAQTSNYKSGFMNWWEKQMAYYLANNDRENEVIIHVDTENSIESLAVQDIARSSGYSVADLSRGEIRDWGHVMTAAGAISGIPIYSVANSLGTDDMPDLYLSNIYRAIKAMVTDEFLDNPITPSCIFVDYLQALPIDPEVKTGSDLKNQRRLQVRQDVYRLRQMANYFNCPVVVGVQAKQVLTGHGGPAMMIPGTYDGEETSSIAQRFDRILSLWLPKTTHTVGDVLTHKGMTYEVDESLMWIKVNKQRGGLPAGRAWQYEVNYQTNNIEAV